MITEHRIQIAVHNADTVFHIQLRTCQHDSSNLIMEASPGRRKYDRASLASLETMMDNIRRLWYDYRVNFLQPTMNPLWIRFEVTENDNTWDTQVHPDSRHDHSIHPSTDSQGSDSNDDDFGTSHASRK